jgi:hypothetical protein
VEAVERAVVEKLRIRRRLAVAEASGVSNGKWGNFAFFAGDGYWLRYQIGATPIA